MKLFLQNYQPILHFWMQWQNGVHFLQVHYDLIRARALLELFLCYLCDNANCVIVFMLSFAWNGINVLEHLFLYFLVSWLWNKQSCNVLAHNHEFLYTLFLYTYKLINELVFYVKREDIRFTLYTRLKSYIIFLIN